VPAHVITDHRIARRPHGGSRHQDARAATLTATEPPHEALHWAEAATAEAAAGIGVSSVQRIWNGLRRFRVDAARINDSGCSRLSEYNP